MYQLLFTVNVELVLPLLNSSDYPDLVGATIKKPKGGAVETTIDSTSETLTTTEKESGTDGNEDEGKAADNTPDTSTQPEGKLPLPKLVINKPQYTRYDCAFVTYPVSKGV